MKNMIQVGNEAQNSEVTLKAIAEALTEVLKAGAESHSEQETIRAAIKAVGDIAQVNGVAITGCNFTTAPEKNPASAISVPTEPKNPDTSDSEDEELEDQG